MKTTDIQGGRRYASRIGGSDFYVHNIHRGPDGIATAVTFSRVDDNAVRFVTPDDFLGMARLVVTPGVAARELAHFMWDEGNRRAIEMNLPPSARHAFDPNSDPGRWLIGIAAAILARCGPVISNDKYAVVLRPFVETMNAELHANAGKGDRPGWLSMSRETAMLEIYYHVAKLQRAVRDDDPARIREYSADVANMAMMAADIAGVLTMEGSSL